MARLRVLIVEDDVELRRMFRQVLAFEGYLTQEAGDGLDALHMIDDQPPDAVILDLGLPVISGRVVREEIAAHAETRDIPVIVVTGEDGTHDDLSVACVLKKPVSADRLLYTVRKCLAAGSGSFSVST